MTTDTRTGATAAMFTAIGYDCARAVVATNLSPIHNTAAFLPQCNKNLRGKIAMRIADA
jgi:hypothetical protein